MPASLHKTIYICQSCARAARSRSRYGSRHLQQSSRLLSNSPHLRKSAAPDDEPQNANSANDAEQGPMSRRLSQMTDEAIETGGRSAQKAATEAGFSDDLKRELEERIAKASFRSENASAFAIAGLRSSAGAGTRDIAAAQAWTGTESAEDASLRMLNDARKPMRAPARSPGIRLPTRVDTGRSTAKGGGSGVRLASARDKTSVYASLKESDMSPEEREKMRKELKERFTPGARSVPASLQGLASLANERIEDAIARGQFKNLPRGKKIERDHNASSPFLDTTEYFMNKIIQKQDIVPPWIEKQQELTSTAARFRGRLRNDWKRHVSRLIASKGGPIEKQLALAHEYARAEALDNPPKTIARSEPSEHMSQISPVTGTLTTPHGIVSVSGDLSEAVDSSTAIVAPPSPPPPTVAPFRDPTWLATERSYHTLAVENLNSLARSYNLMAPDLAKKPYFSLERELRACYADVAPLVAEEILERSRRPARLGDAGGQGSREKSVLDRFSMASPARVYDERKPKYGLKEFWRDLFVKS